MINNVRSKNGSNCDCDDMQNQSYGKSHEKASRTAKQSTKPKQKDFFKEIVIESMQFCLLVLQGLEYS